MSYSIYSEDRNIPPPLHKEEVKECPECGSYYDARSLQCPCELIKEGDKEIARLHKVNDKLLEACKATDYAFSKEQGLDFSYWTQEEHDAHQLVIAAIALALQDKS